MCVCVCVCVCVCAGCFHLRRVNKLYQKYKPGSPQKEHLLIWNSETTQKPQHLSSQLTNSNSYFLATKHEKTIMACIYLNAEYIKILKNSGFCEKLLSENDLTCFSQFLWCQCF